jgi:hypothetical protein
LRQRGHPINRPADGGMAARPGTQRVREENSVLKILANSVSCFHSRMSQARVFLDDDRPWRQQWPHNTRQNWHQKPLLLPRRAVFKDSYVRVGASLRTDWTGNRDRIARKRARLRSPALRSAIGTCACACAHTLRPARPTRPSVRRRWDELARSGLPRVRGAIGARASSDSTLGAPRLAVWCALDRSR